jgi:hypothetical protein
LREKLTKTFLAFLLDQSPNFGDKNRKAFFGMKNFGLDLKQILTPYTHKKYFYSFLSIFFPASFLQSRFLLSMLSGEY